MILKKRTDDPTFRKGIDIPQIPVILRMDGLQTKMYRMLHNASDWFAIKGTTQSYAEAIHAGQKQN
jgi:hypothetical protein